MKAVVVHAVGEIRVDEVPEPAIHEPTGAIEALKTCNQRRGGWHTVVPDPQAALTDHG